MTDQRDAPVTERRVFERPVQFRAAPEGSASPGVLTGYAVVFDSPSRGMFDWWLGDFTEVIDPRAFGEPVEGGGLDLELHHRVIARTNHNSDMLLGTTDAGTLRVRVDDVGVPYEVDLPGTTYGRDLAVSAERGDYRYSSFAFHVLPDGEEWSYDANDQLVRRITRAQLFDVAPVADPAYWGSSTELQRSFDLSEIRSRLDAERSSKAVESVVVAPNARAAALGRAITIRNTLGRGNQ